MYPSTAKGYADSSARTLRDSRIARTHDYLGSTKDVELYNFNLDKAKQLLEQADTRRDSKSNANQ